MDEERFTQTYEAIERRLKRPLLIDGSDDFQDLPSCSTGSTGSTGWSLQSASLVVVARRLAFFRHRRDRRAGRGRASRQKKMTHAFSGRNTGDIHKCWGGGLLAAASQPVASDD